MFDSYGRLLQVPGAFRFSSAALLGRLQISMVGLGVVLLVTARTGSYGLAGLLSATYVIADAALAIVKGSLVDRLGQGRVLAVGISVWGVALSALVLAVELDWPAWSTYVCAAVAGAFVPQVGSSVRARWSHVLADRSQVGTAYALEAVLDEVVFVVGPIVVTLLATLWHPVAGLLVALATGLAGTLAYAAQTGTQPPPHSPDPDSGPRPRMPWRALLPVAVVCLALGALFGAAEVTTVAFTEEEGTKGLAGVLLAVWSFGSLLAGLVTGALRWRSSLETRLRIGTIAMLAAMVPLPFVEQVALMAPVLLLGGLAIAPTMISTMMLTEQVVPSARLTEGMGIMHTALVAGVAPGATFAGLVVDARGAAWAYAVPVAAGLVAVLAAQATRGADYSSR
ncbi:MFS transporter [Nocardioides sp. LHG3406-4]|uniref:MFS transporter n=1 Tax=Nocardioides sp. LHG3406-4 TaxID=2804575 RepID=UPI003CE98D8A